MNTDKEFQKQEELIHWLNEKLSCPYTLDTRNIKLAHSCFDLVLEHHAAICLLYKSGLFGSMFSLLRVEFETCVNGLWLYHVANEEQLQKYENNDLQLGFGSKIEMIESRLGISGSALKIIKSNSWSMFCDFTHGDFQSLVRRSNETHTGAVNYDKNDILTALRHAGIFALFSGVQLAAMTDNNALVEECLSKFKSYGN